MIILLNKFEFSQKDYEMYRKAFEEQLNSINLISNQGKNTNQKHDKTFRGILKNKKEISQFLKQFIEFEVSEENLTIYNSSFINKHYERRESDIIYKLKDREIYYLIEHQSKVDKTMPHRILEYCMELMREIEENKSNKYETNALIIPIVIYTGTQKWTVATNFSDTQKVEEKYKKYTIKLQYQLIDINEYKKEDLMKINTKISSMMILEKCRNSEELKRTIIELGKTNERVEWLKELIEYVFQDILGEDKEEILEKFERKEENNMEDLVERIKTYEERKEKRLIRRGRIEGKVETITNMIKNMLKLNQDEEFIMKCTNAKKEDIEKARKELEMQVN